MFVLKHHKVNSGATHTPTRDNPCQCDDDPKPNPGGGMHSQVRHCAGVRPPGLAHAHCRRRPGLGRKRRRSAPIAEESSRGRDSSRVIVVKFSLHSVLEGQEADSTDDTRI
ncbi:uncharacterized protein LOC122543499 isoform X4 [Chiloscyllium plagiosum]|uniref:uncharacterized protein LOC122543499 isoform X4 n=1 Tax=Chiloscyllium plagiosum TaxID=36176 RepID=UPI001CB81C10|nr:uncharacterized protein LOC122543499 isoform X4 [Chiloscyllium plagiosum]